MLFPTAYLKYGNFGVGICSLSSHHPEAHKVLDITVYISKTSAGGQSIPKHHRPSSIAKTPCSRFNKRLFHSRRTKTKVWTLCPFLELGTKHPWKELQRQSLELSTCFLIAACTTSPGVTLFTMGLALLHQLLIKTIPYKPAYRANLGGIFFSIKIFSFQKCLCIQLAKSVNIIDPLYFVTHKPHWMLNGNLAFLVVLKYN
jgi:hypothetical protein